MMTMSDRDPATDPSIEARRKAARRTALIVAGIAVLIYVAFILSGVLNS